MLLEPFKKAKCRHLRFDFATEPWEQRQYWMLRKEIFCKEQKIFKGTDRDIIDNNAIPIISKNACMGMEDQVVGVVRIDEKETGVWWGSRLGVAQEYRTTSRYNAYHLFPKNETVNPFTLSVGASLIYKAVSTANALGCHRFLAYVQEQNVKFFSRLHWNSLEEVSLHGRIHHKMEADLDFYAPSVYAQERFGNNQQNVA